MKAVVHRDVVADLDAIAVRDPDAAKRLGERVRDIGETPGHEVETPRPGVRVDVGVPGYGIVVDGAGSSSLRVLGVGPLPRLYDPVRLREMSSAAETSSSGAHRVDRTVPTAAPRTRIVALDLGHTADAVEPGPHRVR